MLRISLQSHSTICIFTRSHKKMWVPYVTGTPKISPIGSLIYGITHFQKDGGVNASTHYTTQQSYDSVAHEQSCEQTPHTTWADRWALWLAQAHFTFCHSKCAINVHDQSWRFNVSNPHDWFHESIARLENLPAWWCHVYIICDPE